MVNFGPLAAEIVSLVWGTRDNFNGFRVLAALLHGTLAVGVSQTAALNRGRHLYLAGRPSRWALAHISSLLMVYFVADIKISHFVGVTHFYACALRSASNPSLACAITKISFLIGVCVGW